MTYSRFAIYYLPPDGPLADFGARWLGWDIARGCAVPQPHLPGLDDITMTPRKYGFHGTLKPPFHLAEGRDLDDLVEACTTLAAELAPGECAGLNLARIGGFLALTPRGNTEDLQRIAAAWVRDLDEFRAPPSAAELMRRRRASLTPRQEALLGAWGYPYVMEEFRFHLTLSARLESGQAAAWFETLHHTLPPLPAPFALEQIALCGEPKDGRFELIHRYTLTG